MAEYAFYIKVDENNEAVNNPIIVDNMKQLFPNHDFSDGSAPTGYLPFVRVPEPILGDFQKFDDSKGEVNSAGFADHNGLEYKLVDGVMKDVWAIIDMTDEEKAAKQAVLDKLEVNPPPYPDDGKFYEWNRSTSSWEEID